MQQNCFVRPDTMRQFLTLERCQTADVQRTESRPAGPAAEITGLFVSYGAAGAAAPS